MDALSRKVKAITTGAAKPDRPARAARPQPLDVALKAAIRRSGRTYYDLGHSAGVEPSVILRFMSDDPQTGRGGDIRLSTAAKLAAELGLKLT